MGASITATTSIGFPVSEGTGGGGLGADVHETI
jgi:hypothetical protein